MIFNQVCYRLDLFTYFFRMEQADDFVVGIHVDWICIHVRNQWDSNMRLKIFHIYIYLYI